VETVFVAANIFDRYIKQKGAKNI